MHEPAPEVEVVARVVVALPGTVLRFVAAPHLEPVSAGAVRSMQPDPDPHIRVNHHPVGEVEPMLLAVAAVGLRYTEDHIDVPARHLNDVDPEVFSVAIVFRVKVVLDRADTPVSVGRGVLVVLARVVWSCRDRSCQ